MTFAERESIFSKELLKTKDIASLFDIALSTASQLMQQMKRQLEINNHPLRVELKGAIHVMDYLEWLDITDCKYTARYTGWIDEKGKPTMKYTVRDRSGYVC